MSSVQIRKAIVEDAVPIASLMAELGYSLDETDTASRINLYTDSDDIVLVAEDDGVVVAFLSFHVIPLFHTSSNLGRITAMCVSSQRQRAGIGRRLLETLDKLAIERGCSCVEVTSGDHRAEDAHIFYQACSYQIDCRRFQKILHKANKPQ